MPQTRSEDHLQHSNPDPRHITKNHVKMLEKKFQNILPTVELRDQDKGPAQSVTSTDLLQEMAGSDITIKKS